MSNSAFARMFHAKSIAIVGASTQDGTPSGQPLLHLKNLGYQGTVYPVNPKYESVRGWKCYPSVASLPAVPDVALIAVAAERATDMLAQCGQKGIKVVIVIT